jgi:hypothetical protein
MYANGQWCTVMIQSCKKLAVSCVQLAAIRYCVRTVNWQLPTIPEVSLTPQTFHGVSRSSFYRLETDGNKCNDKRHYTGRQ